MIGSASCDHTIRLWRSRDGRSMCSFKTGVDVFKLLISDNRATVAALGDEHSTRKLIMLQILRSTRPVDRK